MENWEELSHIVQWRPCHDF